MCIAIYKPADKTISKEILKECRDSNKDGCGFAYINTDYQGKKKIVVYKSMDFDSFYHKYERATRLNPESPFIIHFRIATHGTVDKFNCHPFMIDHNTVFIHNGIISGVTKDAKRSDTQMFNEEFLRHVDPKVLTTDGPIKKLIEKFVVGSKLVIMNVEGDVQIYHESTGNWQDGVWYSNYGWRPTTVCNYGHYNSGKGFSIPDTTTTKGNSSWRREKKLLGSKSYEQCEECGHWYMLSMMIAYRVGTELELQCKNCSSFITSNINRAQLVSMDHFIEWNNDEVTYEVY